jgi:phage gp29-like protein
MPAIAHTFRAGRTVQAANTWRQNYDALRWLDISRAVTLIEQERRGVLADVQWIYELVEQSDADMIALVSLRASAIKRLKPSVLTADPATLGFDKALAAEQEAALRATYDAANTAEAVSWLAGATFRGFSILQVIPGADGLPKRFEPLPRWLFARDGYGGAWYWNPTGASLPGASLPATDRIGGDELPSEDFVIRTVPLYIDRVALVCAVRTGICEKDWDAWCEMYGLNQAVLTEPPNADSKDRPAYDAAARAFSDGQGGTIPNGAAITFPQATRGTPPFKDRADYLTSKKILAGTSGKLTMLSQSGSGTLAGGAHQDTFDALADAEAADIAEVLHHAVSVRICAALFPGRPCLARLELSRNAAEDKDAAADRIAKVAPHFEIDPANASELTGLRITSAKAQPTSAQAASGSVAEAAAAAGGDVSATALNGAQISSMVEILSSASAGTLPKESLIPILRAAFPAIPLDVLKLIVGPVMGFEPTTPATNAQLRSIIGVALNASGSDAAPAPVAIEDAAVEALVEARARNLSPVIDRLLDALAETDDTAMRASLAAILDDLPKLATASGEAAAADASLLERILSDAVGAGYASSTAKKGAASRKSAKPPETALPAVSPSTRRPRKGNP